MKRAKARASKRKTKALVSALPERVAELIERERGNLGKVETALELLIIGLVHHDLEPEIRPYYAHQVELALGPLRETLRRLDSVSIDRALAAG